MINEFQTAMQKAGIICNDQIVADGGIHRFAHNGKGDKDCWYVFYDKAGAFGDWSKGIKQTWSINTQGLSFQQKTELHQQTQRAKKALEEETQRGHEEASVKALEIWRSLRGAGHSTYLECKKVSPIGIRFGEGFIAIPLRDAEGNLWSLQKIYDDGKKRFLTGGRKKGCFHHLGTLKDGEAIYVVEGYATGASIYTATHQATVVAFDAGNLDPVIEKLKKTYPNSLITIAADNDQWKEHNAGKEAAEAAAQKWNCHVAFPHFKECSTNPTDFNDLMVLEGKEEVSRQLKASAINPPLLRPINVKDLLTMEFPPREMLLAPLIPQQGLVMLYAPRGIGKTYVTLSIAYAVASGTQMFGGKWKCEKARRVLFIDGEMPVNVLQARVSSIIDGAEEEINNINNLQFISPDLQQDYGIPDLATEEGQQHVEKHLTDIDLLILDNLSALCRSGKENESESWLPLQAWLLKLRRQGISVLFVHHANKTGNQRGTSKKEDLLDTVVVLRKPADYNPKEGARFEVHYEKTRGFYGEDAKPFEACLTEINSKTLWQVKDLEDWQTEKIIELKNDGLSQRDIAQEVGVSASTVNRALKKAKGERKFND